MTPEQQREQWLKRILPALALTVLYFVFVSGWVGEKKQKAEQQFIATNSKGISEAALPGMEQERERVRADIAKLVGSTLFLFALGTIYAVTGTLNMADLGLRVAEIPAAGTAIVRVAAVQRLRGLYA